VTDPQEKSYFNLDNPNNHANQIYESTNTTPDVANNFQISGLVTPTDIEFADNTTSQGFDAVTTATSTVTVNYTNGGSTPVTPSLQSTIVPGGFGFYLDQPISSDINESPQAVSATFDSFNGYANPVAKASFSFDIYSQSDTQPAQLVASYSDSVTLVLSGGGFTVTTGTAPALNGFGLVTPAGSDVAVGYQWNATTVNVPLGVTLAPAESGQLTYVSSVTTSTFGEIDCASNCPSILSYAGFGDPVSKDAGGSGSADPYFALLELGVPTFDPATGMVKQTLLPKSLPSLALPGVPAAAFQAVPMDVLLGVPEPEAWALMLVGVGLVGAASRRRRRLA
jgi:hypothetical protein